MMFQSVIGGDNVFVLDRIEGYMAIIEVNGNTIEVPRHFLPKNAQEGDVLTIIVDETATKRRKKKLFGLK